MIEIRLADLSQVALEPRDVLVVRSPDAISHERIEVVPTTARGGSWSVDA